jgi:small subunit ribosomal protein S2
MAKYALPKTKELLDAGVHFGHQVRRWHPKMEPYIYSVKKNIHIIDLELTEKMLKEAAEFLYETASKGGKIIFVGTKRQARDIIQIEAKRCGAFHVSERWLGGTITNFGVIKKNTDKYTELKRKMEEGEFSHYTKKERLMIEREIEKLDKNVGGIVGMKTIPTAIFAVDAKREKTVIREAGLSGVKVVSLVDTNTDPGGVDYIIPGNDDAIKSVALILKTVADAVEAGYKEFAKKGEEEDKKQNEEKEAPPVEEQVTPVGKELKVSIDESPVSTEKAGKKAVEEFDQIVEELEEDIVEESLVEEKLIEEREHVKPEKSKPEKANVTKKDLK